MVATVLHEKCPKCAKTAKAMFESVLDGGLKRIKVLSCGHTITVELAKPHDFTKLTFANGTDKPYPFQIETMEFAREADFRCGIFHQMGLGKTICALGVVKEYIEDLKPIAIFAKSSLTLNWIREIFRVCGDEDIRFFPNILQDGKDTHFLQNGINFPITLASLDLLRRFDSLEHFNFKTIIIDECQLIKNPSSKRTQAVRKIAAKAKHIMLLSGTPIKNNAAEYFTALNMLNPQMFYQESSYLRNWVVFDGRRYRGLQDPKRFEERTKSFIIRRERKDVEVQLPAIDRQYQYVSLGKEVTEAYERELTKFENAYDEMGRVTGAAAKSEQWTNVLAYMAKMREITGIAKIPATVERIEDFIEQNPEEKLAVFCHHHSVGNSLLVAMRAMASRIGIKEPISMIGVDGHERSLRGELFYRNMEYKLLLGTTLASGEGLNLQSCGNCIMSERQWNPANEEQAECRFVRIGSTHARVVSTYMVAEGTIDEFLTQLIEQKRNNMRSALSYEVINNWDESVVLTELADMLRAKGRKGLWRAA